MEKISITIPGKESVPIVAFLDGPRDPHHVVVFLNGMIAPQVSWHPVVQRVRAQLGGRFSMLTYDRFGQGMTGRRDPSTAHTEFGSDLDEVVRDLSAIIAQIAPTADLVLVGNSIGCAIARRYTAQTPRRVGGIVLLDSIMANSDFADDIFPRPDAPGLSDADRADVIKGREITRRMFSPDLLNAQGFDRRNMRGIMPTADGPVLKGLDGPPLVRVLAHDPEYFARDSKERIGMPMRATKYMQDRWEEYSEGLTKLGKGDGGVRVVQGAGHFIQVDKPQVVADEIVRMIEQLHFA